MNEIAYMKGSGIASSTLWVVILLCSIFVILSSDLVLAESCTTNNNCNLVQKDGCSADKTEIVDEIKLPICVIEEVGTGGTCFDTREVPILTCIDPSCIEGPAHTKCSLSKYDNVPYVLSDIPSQTSKTDTLSFCVENYLCTQSVTVEFLVENQNCIQHNRHCGGSHEPTCTDSYCILWSGTISLFQKAANPSCTPCSSSNVCALAAERNISYTFQSVPYNLPLVQAQCGAGTIPPVDVSCTYDDDCIVNFGRTQLNNTDTTCNGGRICSQNFSIGCNGNICVQNKDASVCVDCPTNQACVYDSSNKYAYCSYDATGPTLLYWIGNLAQPSTILNVNEHFTDYTYVSNYNFGYHPGRDLLGSYLQISSINPVGKKSRFDVRQEGTSNPRETLVCDAAKITDYEDLLSVTPSAIGICVNGGLEGKYDITLEADGRDGGYSASTPSSITFPNLEVDWNKLKEWCLEPVCGNGGTNGWLEAGGTVSRLDRCCSPREMDPSKTRAGTGTNVIINYTNEDCNQLLMGGSELCYYDKNTTHETGSDKGNWLNATNNSGEIVYEGCGDKRDTSHEDGIEYVANNDKWVSCTSSGFTIPSNSATLNISGFDSEGNPKTHGFICVNRLAPRQNSIWECSPDASSYLDDSGPVIVSGGVEVSRGVSANVTVGSPKKVYFCAEDTSWSTDLDTTAKAGVSGEVCNVAIFPIETHLSSKISIGSKWTGSLCCGELDDWKGTYPENAGYAFNNPDYIQREYYNDKSSDNNGACFNGVYQQNEKYLTLKYTNYTANVVKKSYTREVPEVIVWNGTFQGCAIDHVKALANKQDSGFINPGKVQETVQCEIPKDLTQPTSSTLLSLDHNKPYDGSFADFDNISDYVYGSSSTLGQRNNFLINLKDYSNPQGNNNNVPGKPNLITDNEYCNIKNISGDKYYYCSYTEVWNQVDIEEGVLQKTHLSFIPWKNDSAQQAECCTPSQCWDGSVCVDSIFDLPEYNAPYKIMNNYGDGFVCKAGKWEWVYNKMNWDGTDSGYCYENTQCLVSSGGQVSKEKVLGPTRYSRDILEGIGIPRCINDSEYYSDHYCENGTWTSRTKFAAAALQKIGASSGNSYTLYCDSYDKVLNRYNYTLSEDSQSIQNTYFEMNPTSGCTSFGNGGVETVPCANHVCILVVNPAAASQDRKVYLATSINHRLNKTMSYGEPDTILDFGTVFGSSLSGCVQKETDRTDNFVTCQGGSGNVFYHGKLGLILYTRESLSFSGADATKVSYLTLLKGILFDPITFFVNAVSTNQNGASGFDYTEFQTLANDLIGTNPTIRKPFECDNCTDNNANNNHIDEICGERGNPRQIYDLSTLYWSKSGAKEIVGIAELQKDKDLPDVYSYSALRFSGFTQDICSTFKLPLSGYQCKTVGAGRAVIFTPYPYNTDNSFETIVDIASRDEQHWVFTATSTRIGSESTATN